MNLSLMDATAWTLALVGLVSIFRFAKQEGRGRGDDPKWARSFGVCMTIVAMVQLMVLADVLRVGFLEGNLVLPALLLLLGLMSMMAVRERTLPVLAVYAAVLQFCVHWRIIGSVA